MKKEQFESPIVEVVTFSTSDYITTSPTGGEIVVPPGDDF